MSRIGVLRWMPHMETNSTNSTMVLDRNSILGNEEPVQNNFFIIVTIVAALALHAQIRQSNKAGISALVAIVSLIITVLLAPLLGILLLVLACIRQAVKAILIATSRKDTFAGLMHGNDAFWAVEEETSKAVINVLGVADFRFIVSATNHYEEPLQTLREIITDRLLTAPVPFPKLLCYRRQFMGYFYWEKQSNIKIDNHVRWMDIEDQCDGTISESLLRGYISSLANSPLPANHLSGWEILVGRYPISFPESDPFDFKESGGNSITGLRYPILFRIHHTLGDGVALVNLLLDSLADPYSRATTPVSNEPFCWNDQHFPNLPSKSSSMIFSQQSDNCSSLNKSANYLSVPEEIICMKKSASYSFENINHFQQKKQTNKFNNLNCSVRAACRKFLNLIEETGKLKNIDYQPHSLPDINLTVNDRPSSEFLELMNHVNNYNGCRNNYISQKDRNEFENVFKQECKLRDFLFELIISKLKAILNLICQSSFMMFAPTVILNQALNQTCDNNPLHGPHLSGHKVVAWHFEQDDNVNLLLMDKIKRIRTKTGAHFSEVILTALSSSLETFFSHCKEIPHSITIVIPALIDKLEVKTATIKLKSVKTKVTKLHLNNEIYKTSECKLDNKFAVAMLPLPILNNARTKPALFNKLGLVQHQCSLLRDSPDYYINYWLLRVVSTFLPVFILREVIKSTQCTMVVSNLPGPPRLSKLVGHTLHNLVFWVPNKETTGVGVSILSYAGRLQLGILADRALIPCQQDAQVILDGIITSINEMYQMSLSS